MVIIVLCSWPTDKTKDMLKASQTVPPLPDFLDYQLYSSSSLDEGSKTIAIYRFDSSRIDEAYDYLYARVQRYYDIPGFTFEMKRWLDEEESKRLAMNLMSE